MIFVMLGTQKQSFIRLLKELEKCKCLNDEEVIIQVGNTKYNNDKFKIFDFVSEKELNYYIDKADIIITHGGAGSIFSSLNKGKKVIAVPRLKKYNEHINDHQIQICNKLYTEGYIEKYELGDLNEVILKTKEKEFKKYIKDKSYIDIIRKVIDNI